MGHRIEEGGAVEVLLLKDRGEGTWECLVRPGRRLRPGRPDGRAHAVIASRCPETCCCGSVPAVKSPSASVRLVPFSEQRTLRLSEVKTHSNPWTSSVIFVKAFISPMLVWVAKSTTTTFLRNDRSAAPYPSQRPEGEKAAAPSAHEFVMNVRRSRVCMSRTRRVPQEFALWSVNSSRRLSGEKLAKLFQA